MATAFNVWTPEGNVLPNETSPHAIIYSNPNVIYEGNPQILAGPNVFKMWCQGQDNTTGMYGIYYFESADGLTSWTPLTLNVPIFTSGSNADPKVYHVGSLYYIYIGQVTIVLLTSSDGVTSFTNHGAVLSPGAAGQWDSAAVFQLALADIIAGTWYAYYGGLKTGGASTDYSEGIATSPDGIVWTKGGSNPVFAGGGNPTFHKIGSTYYGWCPNIYTDIVPNIQDPGGSFRVEITRFSAPAVTGPWTKLTVAGRDIATYYAAIPADYVTTQSHWLGNQIGDPSIVDPGNGNTYIYYSLSYAGGAVGLNGAVATGTTMAQLVQTYEGVVGAPISGASQLNLVTLASDPGTGANANPIGGNWSPIATTAAYSACQRLSNLIQGTTATNNYDSYWNALTWANDQWAQSVVSKTAASLGFVGAGMRMNTSGVVTEYRVNWGAAAPGASGTSDISKVIAGTPTAVATWPGLTVNIGDSIMGVANGTTVMFYWKGIILGVIMDSSVTSGAAGLELYNNAVVANAAISSWSGGSFQAAPPINPTTSGTGSLMLMGTGT